MFPINVKNERISKLSPASDHVNTTNDNRLNHEKINKDDSIFDSNKEESKELYNADSRTMDHNDKSLTIPLKNRNLIVKKKLIMNNEKNISRKERDLEIMNKLTSPEWLEKPFSRPIIHMVETNEIPIQREESASNVSSKTVKSNVTKDSTEITSSKKLLIDDNENITISSESCDYLHWSSSSLKDEQIEENDVETDCCDKLSDCVSFDTLKYSDVSKKAELQTTSTVSNKNAIIDDLYIDKFFDLNDTGCEALSHGKQDVSLKRDHSTFSSQLSSEALWINKAFMERNLRGSDNNYDSDEDVSSSTWSFDTPVLARVMCQKKSLDYTSGRQMSDESAYNTAIGLIIEETKNTLGKLLVEGLYIVARKYRDDPFKCLGKWLLIQADIRDETEEENLRRTNDT